VGVNVEKEQKSPEIIFVVVFAMGAGKPLRYSMT